jgi:hypothetical protein
MKIKMLTTSCGPDPKFNFNEGQKRNVSVEEARYWFEMGVCELLEPWPVEKAVVAAPEKAVVIPAEKAVISPPETAAKGKGKATTFGAPVAPPASPVATKSIADVPEWGKPEVK